MKDIITGTSMTEVKYEAKLKYEEYREAVKIHGKQIYKDLKDVYYQVYKGKKVIDIHKVIQKGGLLPCFHPRLAIAKLSSKKIFCKYYRDGMVKYLNNEQGWRTKEYTSDIILPGCLPVYKGGDTMFNLEAPVPICPPKLLPAKLTDDYYILWEVDVWKMVPPTDPYLLRRITKNMFVVVAGWDLTEIEKAAMHGRMY